MAASAYVGTDITSVGSGSWTTFTSLADTIDTDAYASGGSIVTIPADGVYLVAAFAGVAVNSTSQRGVRILLNGETVVPCGELTRGVAEDANTGRGSYTWQTLPLRAGDELEFQGWHNHGSAQNMDLQVMVLRLPTTNIWCGNHADPAVTCSSNSTPAQLPLAPRPVNLGGWTKAGDTLTVPTTGNYLVLARADFTELAQKAFWIQVEVNGTPLVTQHETSRTAGHFHGVAALSAGDTIEYFAVKEDGGTAASVPVISCSLTLVEVPSCASLSSSGMTVPNGFLGACGFDGEYVDTDAYHSNVTNNSRITIPTGKSGLYLFGSKLQCPSNLRDGQASFGINGVYGLPVWYLCASFANGGDFLGQLTVLDVAVGDYVEAVFESDSGGASSGTPEFFGVHADGFTYDTFEWEPWYECPWTRGGWRPRVISYN